MPTPAPTRGVADAEIWHDWIADAWQAVALRNDACGQRADIDEGAPAQAKIGRNRQRKAQFGGLRPDEAATQRRVGHEVMRAGAPSLEAAQIVAAQEEPVDDFLTAAGKQVQVAGAASRS